MGLKVTEPNGPVSLLLEQDGKKAVRGGADLLRKAAQEIANRAVEYAPVDKSNLEQAIHVNEDRGGQNRRVRTYVEVGGVVNGVNVDQYATQMHEGVYNLGPKSVEKAQRTGKPVGRKYLERAADELEEGIAKEFEDLIARELS